MRKFVVALVLLTIAVIIALFLIKRTPFVGEKIDEYKSIPVFYNGGKYAESHGKSYCNDGYYYGLKWQCVEFVKRFYYNAKGHKMPDGFGNAKDFFDPAVPQGKLNKARGLVQYRNGGNVKPAVDDIIVFTDTMYGHVAIVCEVGPDFIEVVQQNVGTTRDRYELETKNGNYYVGGKRKPAGWLRKEESG